MLSWYKDQTRHSDWLGASLKQRIFVPWSVKQKPLCKHILLFLPHEQFSSPFAWACCDNVDICWSVENPLRWWARVMIQLRGCLQGTCIPIARDITSVVIASVTPVSACCLAHFQELLNTRDIKRSSPSYVLPCMQSAASSLELWTTLQSHSQSASQRLKTQTLFF